MNKSINQSLNLSIKYPPSVIIIGTNSVLRQKTRRVCSWDVISLYRKHRSNMKAGGRTVLTWHSAMSPWSSPYLAHLSGIHCVKTRPSGGHMQGTAGSNNHSYYPILAPWQRHHNLHIPTLFLYFRYKVQSTVHHLNH